MKMCSKALVRLSILGCALALAACGGGGTDGGNGNGGNGGGAGNGAGTMTTGTGGMGSSSGMMGGTGGTGTSGMMGGTGGTGGGMMGGTGGTGGGNSTLDCGSDPALDGTCKDMSRGVYAIKTVLDTYWYDEKNQGTPIVDPGRGNLTIYLMGRIEDICDNGTDGVGVMKACGSDMPPFTSDVTCDAYQLQFDPSIWDQPTMPTFTTKGSTTGFNPGDTLTLAQAIGLVGISLDDPMATWPTSSETGTFTCAAGSGMQCFPDQDGDGQPGITVTLKTGSDYRPNGCGGFDAPFTYRGSPTSVDPAAAGGTGSGIRAKEVHIGLRTTLGGSGVIGSDCMSGEGPATAPETAIESRAFDCKVDPASLPNGDTDHPDNNCTAAEATFVDDNVPNYHVLQKDEKPPTTGLNFPLAHAGDMLDQTPSPGPTASMKRLGDLDGMFTCANVRAAFGN